MRAERGVAGFLLVVLFAGCLQSAPGGEVDPGPHLAFDVRVLDGGSGAPIEDARVGAALALAGPCGPQLAWREWALEARGGGRFELVVPAPSGDDTVIAFRANASGYAPAESVITREDARQPLVRVNLTLHPLGTLVVPPGDAVGLHDLTGGRPPLALPPGEHAVRAGPYAWGRGGEHGTLEVPPQGDAAVPAARGENASGERLEGVVLVDGSPRKEARVFLGPEGGAREALPRLEAAALTDVEGRFSLPWTPGNATVVAWVPGEQWDAGSLHAVEVDAAAADVIVTAAAPRC